VDDAGAGPAALRHLPRCRPAVRDVYVDGHRVVPNGRVLTLDCAGALERLTEAQKRMEATVPKRDPLHRRSGDIAPLSLPTMGPDDS
jgi:hypothetical protein